MAALETTVTLVVGWLLRTGVAGAKLELCLTALACLFGLSAFAQTQAGPTGTTLVTQSATRFDASQCQVATIVAAADALDVAVAAWRESLLVDCTPYVPYVFVANGWKVFPQELQEPVEHC